MIPEADAALALLLSIHEGDPWHGPSTMQLLRGVGAADAVRSPAAGVHSIWQLVLHMTAWTREVASRLAGADAKDPVEGDWPPVAHTSDSRWREAVRALDEAHRALAVAARAVPDDRWAAIVRDRRGGAGAAEITRLATLRGLAAHDAYHGGQIGLLRKWLA